MEIICMKCPILFSGKNKKNIKLPSAELTQRMVKAKYIILLFHHKIIELILISTRTYVFVEKLEKCRFILVKN